MNFIRTISLLATAGALALPAAASADTLVHPVTGAENLASGGGWLAWSQPAPDGGFQLALRAPDGTVSVPAVGKFATAPDPAIGSDQFGADGRKLEVVYERDGDLFAYDLDARTEAKVPGVNTSAREHSPGISYGRIVFVRDGKRGGTFLRRDGRTTRIATVKPGALAYNGSRIAYPSVKGIILHRISGRGRDSFVRPTGSVDLRDLQLTRYSLTFLADGGKLAQTNRFGGSSDVQKITGLKASSTPLSATARSFAYQGSFVRWYLDDAGLQRISTQNLFR